jgi:3-oxoacyl-[acyl-carrier-protein] synthase II
MELKRAVITGIGAITPVGNTAPDYWNGLVHGVSGADFITLFDASKFKTRFACEVKGFDPVAYLDRKEARKVDRFTQLALVSSYEAIKDAGISKESVNPDRTGVIFSTLDMCTVRIF